jgi:TolA-binding protein
LIRFVEEHQEYLSACVELPGFLEKVAAAYAEAGRPIELIKLFNYLVDRQWAASGVPYMYEEIANNAELIGDVALAERSLRTSLRRYPSSPRARLIMERLGGFSFADSKFREVKETLLWLLNKGEHAQKPESYYYLGRSLWSLKEYSQAAKAIDLYLVSAGTAGVRVLPDAYFVAVSARESTGDRKGALRLLDAGLKLPKNPRSEEFLYKAGEINLHEGNTQRARTYFEQVAKTGKDPDWQRLAQQALDSLDMKTPR